MGRSHLAFLALPNPELAVARVALRVQRGGHHVPEDVVRRRFTAGLRNFFALYRRVADTWQVFDNSTLEGLRVIAAGSRTGTTRVDDPGAWHHWKSLAP